MKETGAAILLHRDAARADAPPSSKLPGQAKLASRRQDQCSGEVAMWSVWTIVYGVILYFMAKDCLDKSSRYKRRLLASRLLRRRIAPSGSPNISVRAHLKLTYQDAHGVVTHRDVVVSKYCRTGKGHIEAFCQLRNADRVFRLDRIKAAIDLDTGEVLPLQRIRHWLVNHRV